MNVMRIHCPLCNATDIDGQGLVMMNGAPLVQYLCKGCGELFFEADRRTDSPLPLQSE
jgi:transposase-like protein